MKLKKYVVLLACVVCLTLTSTSTVLAEEISVDKDSFSYSNNYRWENVDSIDTFIENTNSGYSAHAIVVANNPSMNIKGKLYLQKYKNGYWQNITTWSLKGNGFVSIKKPFSAYSGKYRTKLKLNVGGESITSYSSEYEIN